MQKIFLLLFICTGLFAKEIVSAWESNAGELNPHAYSSNQMYAQIMLYQPLVRYDENGQFVPEVAESWTVLDDGRRYIFTIKKDLKFSDGSTLDAFAIEKNFDIILGNKKEHGWLGIINNIQHAKALDALHFEILLKAPYVGALNELSLPRPFRFASLNAFENGVFKKPIGSGAWMLKESRLGVKDVFVPNPYYQGEHNKEITQLTMRILPDANARVLAFLSGDVDILVGKDSFLREHYIKFSKDNRFKLVKSLPQGTFSIVLNASKGRGTEDKNIRQAIMHAVNKDIIVEKIFLNIDKKADTLFNPELPFCNVDLKAYQYDIDRAKALRENAKNVKLKFVYVGNNPVQKTIAEAIQNDLYKIGIQVELVAYESIAFYQAQENGDFDLIFNETWGNPFDPHSFVASMLAPSHADFAAQKDLPNKKEIDNLIRNILQNNQKEILQENYNKLLLALHESAVYLPLSYGFVLGAFNTNTIKSYSTGAMQEEFLWERIQLKD